MDKDEKLMFATYGRVLQLWSRGYNTAEIAGHLKIFEWEVCRMLWHWRELASA